MQSQRPTLLLQSRGYQQHHSFLGIHHLRIRPLWTHGDTRSWIKLLPSLSTLHPSLQPLSLVVIRMWLSGSQQQRLWMKAELEGLGLWPGSRPVRHLMNRPSLWRHPPQAELIDSISDLPSPKYFQLHPFFIWKPEHALMERGLLCCLQGPAGWSSGAALVGLLEDLRGIVWEPGEHQRLKDQVQQRYNHQVELVPLHAALQSRSITLSTPFCQFLSAAFLVVDQGDLQRLQEANTFCGISSKSHSAAHESAAGEGATAPRAAAEGGRRPASLLPEPGIPAAPFLPGGRC
ncbi:uncharacterized protein LOC130206854 isoform X2 [Pseudoliparis swirei]|nr:uncharacterized protein LOC130206854 isoform X2 [Pseudoliparis swirei]XP_056291041.1 uncharacterized protein LOC130206854 isoform X2 [Pseudoliparis swirei]